MSEDIETLTNKDEGYLRIQNVLICWGKQLAKRDEQRPWTASFEFEFEKEFKEAPTITTGIHLNGNGQMMSVYEWNATTTHFVGRLNNNYNPPRSNSGTEISENTEITVNYTAIGEAKR